MDNEIIHLVRRLTNLEDTANAALQGVLGLTKALVATGDFNEASYRSVVNATLLGITHASGSLREHIKNAQNEMEEIAKQHR